MASIFDRISEHRANFSNSYRKVADYLIENYEVAAFMTAFQVAQEAEVSESVVIRFSKAIGYTGFPEMKKSLQKEIKKNMTLPQKMCSGDLKEDMPGETIYTAIMTQEYNNVLKTMKDPYNLQVFPKVADMVTEAEVVYIAAARTLDLIGRILEYTLGVLGKKVFCVNPECSMDMRLLINAKEQDALVAISFARYDKRIKMLQEYFKERKAGLITIADSIDSPDLELADLALFVSAESSSYTNSYCTLLAMFNAIVAAVSTKNRERAIENLGLVEKLGLFGEFT